MNILILDGYNLIHRAAHGFKKGDHHVIFNFFRGLRPIVEKFKPTQAYFVTEGIPTGNIELHSGYKANRKSHSTEFKRQLGTCIEILQASFPLVTVYHPDFEADDVIDGLIRYWHPSDNVVVVSSDTDFIQLLNEFTNVKIWNPIKKKYVITPDYDYVQWKALRGDPTDAIPGIPGVGDKTAHKLVKDTNLLQERLKDASFKDIFHRNLKLVKFFDLGEKMNELQLSKPFRDWDAVRRRFYEFKFFSIINDKSWQAFVITFDPLWFSFRKNHSIQEINRL